MMTSFKSASPIAEIPSSYSGEPMMEIIARFGYVTIGKIDAQNWLHLDNFLFKSFGIYCLGS